MNIAHTYQESGIRFCEPQAAQLHIYHTMRGLQQAGHNVALLALQGRQVVYTPDLSIFTNSERQDRHFTQLGMTGSTAYQMFESTVRRLQSELHLPYLALFDSHRLAEAGTRCMQDVDLIHERFNLLALGTAWASKKLGIPLVLEVNADLLEQREYKGRPERGLRRLYALWATRLCFDTAARIICISESLKDHLSRKWKVSPHKLCVLPCAADTDVFAARQDGARVRRRLGLASEPVVVWVGGFYPWHDLPLVLDSFARLLETQPTAKLVLVGDGPTRSAIAQAVAQKDLGHSVIMTGAVANAQVPELLSIADIAVVPSAPVTASQGGTGAPLKLFEYMAASKAIVATATEQAAQIIRHGETGLLVEAGNTAAFAEAMHRLLIDPAERTRLGRNARKQAVEKHSWMSYTVRLEEIYASVLGRSPNGAAPK